MKPWPDKSEFFGIPDGRENYERARAEAAIARLRKAVEALKLIDGQNPTLSEVIAQECLRQIGDIPEQM